MNANKRLIPSLIQTHYAQHNEDLPFWLELARETGGPVLELGCGTGRVLIPLAEQMESSSGWRAVGLDRDAGMLAFLRGIARDEMRGSIHLVRGDIPAFHFGQLFRLILLPCNTLSTLERAKRRRLFARVRQHLAPGGRFAASIPNPAWLLELPPISEPEVEATMTHPLTGNVVQISSAWERSENAFHLRWHYDQLLPDGRVDRLTLETAHDLAQVEDYRKEFGGAGLRMRAAYGDFDLSAFRDDSPNYIFVLEKG